VPDELLTRVSVRLLDLATGGEYGMEQQMTRQGWLEEREP
jgi:hypothetical protein